MAGETGLNAGTHNIVIAGKPPIVTQHQITTVANMYPGRLVAKDATDFAIKVGTALLKPRGWLGFEDAPADFKPAAKTSIYQANDMAPVIRGGGFVIEAHLALGCNAPLDSFVGNWADGEVVAPVRPADGGFWLGIPFVKKASVFDTGIDIPQYMQIRDVVIEVTLGASAVIDVGIINAVEGGDEDGFLDGEDLTNLGLVPHNMADGTAANITLGVYLTEVQLKDKNDVYDAVPTLWKGNGTLKSICYVANASVTGWIWVLLEHPGLTIVGKCEQAVDATSAAANMLMTSFL